MEHALAEHFHEQLHEDHQAVTLEHPFRSPAVLASLVAIAVIALAAGFCFLGVDGAGRCFGLCVGIRVMAFRWHPRFVSVLQASPLCGAAPTFLCRRKEK